MKIAAPTRNGRIDGHFGQCELYTVFTVEEKRILKTEILPSPQGCGCKSGIAADLSAMGVTLMLAGNMGEGAVQKLAFSGIQVVRGCHGDVNQVVRDWLDGKISDNGQSCAHHEHHHGEGHGTHHH